MSSGPALGLIAVVMVTARLPNDRLWRALISKQKSRQTCLRGPTGWAEDDLAALPWMRPALDAYGMFPSELIYPMQESCQLARKNIFPYFSDGYPIFANVG